ncbi:hypothetical protein CCHL11_07981 [Colletotrichum chlorophyti]|uniref:Uncharacterized protein n=1 Tax=Colletotrichum chlorophyti TaxID=708187 RepID=A0A1Q8RM51_9PEZI|nr:hypothetical protein CCHL11_07981 [Colletotrichum chlorophyti]
MERSPEPYHVLQLTRGHDNAIVVSHVKSKGGSTPLYSISHNDKMSKMEIRRIKRDAISTEQRPVGSIKLRTIPPRVEVSVRGVSFKMTRKHPLSNSHNFSFLGSGEMRWEELGKKGTGMRLVDFNGKVWSHFRPKLLLHVINGGSGADQNSPGSKARWAPGFELHAALADLDLDLVVTTGLAAAEHRQQLTGDWETVQEHGQLGGTSWRGG